MALPTMVEKLQIKDEKNILIQGLPSSLEKQFIKLAFCKSVTPLLKTRKIDFALVFAISKKQLCDILKDVIPAMQTGGKCWIAYPKLSSKIASDLSRCEHWNIMEPMGFEPADLVTLDNMWNAMWFRKNEQKMINPSKKELTPLINGDCLEVSVPDEVKSLFKKNRPAGVFFESLSSSNKQEYVQWIEGAKKVDTKTRRLDAFMEMMNSGKKSPSAK
ncbi:MAG: YdeI/OmpD-associated family protein [Ferruginibacter sp.]